MMPMRKSVGKTVFGVRIGCQAFSRCCLNAVSRDDSQTTPMSQMRLLTGGPAPAALLFLRGIAPHNVVVVRFVAPKEAHD